MNILGPLIGAGVIVKLLNDRKTFRADGDTYRNAIVAAAMTRGFSPSILAAILWQESRFNPKAQGPTNDVGIAQFTPIAVLDLVDNGYLPAETTIDDLWDPHLSIVAAAALIDLNRKRSGSLYTSIRAYNVGIGAAMHDPSAGLSYLTDVLTTAASDFILSTFEGRT